METFRSCPICLEVPEKEIYQCLGGHVICHLCISKIRENRCPTCRIPFGVPKIRSRIFEAVLESQNYECKFMDRGCTHFTKRGEITSHANVCSFNPNTVPLCAQLGYGGCSFKLGRVSKSEILYHFLNAHNRDFRKYPNLAVQIAGNEFMSLLCRKRKLAAPTSAVAQFFAFLLSSNNSETTPLFLIYGKVNRGIGFLSFMCVELFKPEESKPPNQVLDTVFFSLNKDSSSPPSNLAIESSSRTMTAVKVNPFPVVWSMKICSIGEAASIFKASPINIPMSLLVDSQFGANTGDHLKVEIYSSEE